MTQEEKSQREASERLAKLFGAKTRITEEDELLIRSVFNTQIEPYMALRNLFFGFDLTETEQGYLKGIHTPQFKALLHKLFLPQISKEAPIEANKDLWVTMDFDEKMVNQDNFDTKYDTKVLFLEMVDKALARIDDDTERVSLVIKRDLPFILARNSFIGHIEGMISKVLMVLGTRKDETPEEALMRLKKDSSK